MGDTRRALLWSIAERYGNVVITLVSTVVLSRLLTPEQIGIFSLCAVIVGFASVLRDAGVSEYLIQEKELTLPAQRSAMAVAIIMGWGSAYLLYATTQPLSAFFGDARMIDTLAVLCLNFVLLPLTSPAYALLHRSMDFRSVFAVNMASGMAAAVVSIALAMRGAGALALAWGAVAAVVAQTLVMPLLAPRSAWCLPRIAGATRVIRFGSLIVASKMVEDAGKTVHEPLIAKAFGFATVGLFSRANGLVDMFNATAGAAIIRVAGPAFARLLREGQPIAQTLERASVVYVGVSWPLFAFIAVMAEPMILLVFGRQWAAAASFATPLALAAIPAGVVAMVPHVLSATGHAERRLRLGLWLTPFHVAAVVVAAQYGAQAIAWAWLAGSLLTLALSLRVVHKAYGLRPARLLAACAPSALLTMGTVAGVLAGQWLAGQLAAAVWAELLGAAACGGVAWWVLAERLRHPAHAEIAAMLSAWAVHRRSNPK